MEEPEIIAEARNILKQWDEGMLSYYSVEARLNHLILDPLIDNLKNGGEYWSFESCCCPADAHKETEVFDCRIIIEDHSLMIKPVKNENINDGQQKKNKLSLSKILNRIF